MGTLEAALTTASQKSDQNAILITGLHEKIDALYFIVDSLNLRKASNESSTETDDPMKVLISNGLIDAESYLEKSLENEEMSVRDFKNTYGEDGWYFLFEKLFRGSEEEITKRQSFYIGYIQDCYRLLSLKNKLGYVLDFGSGKGEFLALLSQSGIPGKGVDTNCLNTEYVRQKGLDAICEDGIKYMESINDNELFGITTFQVAEHLEFDTLKRFLHLAYQKIMPGGILIVETVNPSCAYSMQYFYLDPTHIRPYPPETLRFYSEWLGFENIKIAYYIPVQREASKDDTSNYMGYALIGYKPEEVEQV
jgi:O-antigen chain-terminating methyltransferase